MSMQAVIGTTQNFLRAYRVYQSYQSAYPKRVEAVSKIGDATSTAPSRALTSILGDSLSISYAGKQYQELQSLQKERQTLDRERRDFISDTLTTGGTLKSIEEQLKGYDEKLQGLDEKILNTQSNILDNQQQQWNFNNVTYNPYFGNNRHPLGLTAQSQLFVASMQLDSLTAQDKLLRSVQERMQRQANTLQSQLTIDQARSNGILQVSSSKQSQLDALQERIDGLSSILGDKETNPDNAVTDPDTEDTNTGETTEPETNPDSGGNTPDTSGDETAVA